MIFSSRNNEAWMRQQILRALQQPGGLDQRAQKLVRRLACEGAKEIVRLEKWCERKGRASCWRDIVLACIDAERQAREFHKHIEQANKTPERLEKARKALAALRGFFSENKTKSWAVLWDNGAAIERGLDLLDYGIDTERCVAKESFAQFGATRKKKIKARHEMLRFGCWPNR